MLGSGSLSHIQHYNRAGTMIHNHNAIAQAVVAAGFAGRRATVRQTTTPDRKALEMLLPLNTKKQVWGAMLAWPLLALLQYPNEGRAALVQYLVDRTLVTGERPLAVWSAILLQPDHYNRISDEINSGAYVLRDVDEDEHGPATDLHPTTEAERMYFSLVQNTAI